MKFGQITEELMKSPEQSKFSYPSSFWRRYDVMILMKSSDIFVLTLIDIIMSDVRFFVLESFLSIKSNCAINMTSIENAVVRE